MLNVIHTYSYFILTKVHDLYLQLRKLGLKKLPEVSFLGIIEANSECYAVGTGR